MELLQSSTPPPERWPSKRLPPLTTLPNELVLLIFTFLDHKDIDTIMSLPDVSRHFNHLFRVITDAPFPLESHYRRLTQLTDMNDQLALSRVSLQSGTLERVIVEITTLNDGTIDNLSDLPRRITAPFHLSLLAEAEARSALIKSTFTLPYTTITYETLTILHLDNTTIDPLKHHFPNLLRVTFVDCGVESKSPFIFLDAPLLDSLTLKGSSKDILGIFDFPRSLLSSLILIDMTGFDSLDGLTCPNLIKLLINECNLSICRNLNLARACEIKIRTRTDKPWDFSHINTPMLSGLYIDMRNAPLAIYEVNAPALKKLSLITYDLSQCYKIHTPSLEDASVDNMGKELKLKPSSKMDLACFKDVTTLQSYQASGLIHFTPHLTSLTLETQPPTTDLFHTPNLFRLTINCDADIGALPFNSCKEVRVLDLLVNTTDLDTEAISRTFPNLKSLRIETEQDITLTNYDHCTLLDMDIRSNGNLFTLVNCSFPSLTVFGLNGSSLFDTLPNCDNIDFVAPSLKNFSLKNVNVDTVDLTNYPRLTSVSVAGSRLKKLVLNTSVLQYLDVCRNKSGLDAIISPRLDLLEIVVSSGTPRLGWEPLDCLLLSPVFESDPLKKTVYVSGYVPKRGVKREHTDDATAQERGNSR